MTFPDYCHAVVRYLGYEAKPNKWLYYDPYGCDLEISGEVVFAGTEFYIEVKLGGKLCYTCYVKNDAFHKANHCKFYSKETENAAWIDLIKEIWSVYAEEEGQVRHTLIVLCKREAEEMKKA